MTMWETIVILIGLGSAVFSCIQRVRSTSRSRVRVVSDIGLVLVAIGLFAFSLGHVLPLPPFSGNCPCPPISSISDTNISGLTIETEWWSSQVTHSSTTIDVWLTPTPSLSPTAQPSRDQTPSRLSPEQAQSQLTPVGTPNMPIVQAFGAHYDVFAKATLSASAFDVDPREQAIQSLDQT